MSKYIRWQTLLTLLGIVLIATVLLYIAQSEEPVELPPVLVSPLSSETVTVQVRGGTYVEGVAGYPWHINPLFSQLNDVDRDLCALIFEGLTTVNERAEIVPLLADHWRVSEDGLDGLR